jgi:hypothetical protein
VDGGWSHPVFYWVDKRRRRRRRSSRELTLAEMAVQKGNLSAKTWIDFHIID